MQSDLCRTYILNHGKKKHDLHPKKVYLHNHFDLEMVNIFYTECYTEYLLYYHGTNILSYTLPSASTEETPLSSFFS